MTARSTNATCDTERYHPYESEQHTIHTIMTSLLHSVVVVPLTSKGTHSSLPHMMPEDLDKGVAPSAHIHLLHHVLVRTKTSNSAIVQIARSGLPKVGK